MRPITSTLVCAAIISVTALGLQGLRAVGADDQRAAASVALAKQEKAIAEQALLITDLEAQGQRNVGFRDVPRWSRRLLEATRKSGASQAEVTEAIKQHIARMEKRLAIVTKLHMAAAATQGDLLDAKYEAIEAQALLQDNSK